MGRATHTKEDRQRIVGAYQQSGLSVKAFAARESLAASTLYWWLRERKSSSVPKVARVIVTGRVEKAEKAMLVTPVVVEIGGARISVKSGFEPAVLDEVLMVLEQRRGDIR